MSFIYVMDRDVQGLEGDEEFFVPVGSPASSRTFAPKYAPSSAEGRRMYANLSELHSHCFTCPSDIALVYLHHMYELCETIERKLMLQGLLPEDDEDEEEDCEEEQEEPSSKRRSVSSSIPIPGVSSCKH